MPENSSKIAATFLKVAGFIFLSLGMIGLFLPLLPTTPFLLLAAACFAKSSDKFYQWLINHRVFGNYIRNYREKKGITLRSKVLSLTILWATIISSCLWGTDKIFVRIALPTIALLVTIHILRFRTLRGNN